jgi:SAM-dependent methyltransferase
MFRNTAHVYDLIYSKNKDYPAEAREVHALIQSRKPGAHSLLDVACGTGAHLLHLRQWYDVVGLDSDPGMLRQASGRLPGARLVEADMRSFLLYTTFDAVICLFSSIGYMGSRDELNAAVTSMARHLSPGGVLIVDGWVRPDAWRGETSTHMETADDETTKVARVGLARRSGNKTRLEMHHLIATSDAVDYVVDHHELTLFELAEYTDAFAKAGLHVEVVDSPMPDRDRYIGTLR